MTLEAALEERDMKASELIREAECRPQRYTTLQVRIKRRTRRELRLIRLQK